MNSNVMKGTTCTSLNWSEFKRIIIKVLGLFNKDMFFVILVSLAANMSKFLLQEHAFIWNKESGLFL